MKKGTMVFLLALFVLGSIERQAAALGVILELECGAPRVAPILDCAGGTGTQTLGLASLGFQRHGLSSWFFRYPLSSLR
jgi:hypothetical protein